jgi:flavin-dependent dehydrogenase
VRHDAIVIGAGPAGATAALMLARAGWSVALVEKTEFPRRKVCGEFISATSMPVLRELGVLDAFLQRAGPEVRRVGLFAGDVVLDAPMPQPSNSVSEWGRALGREHLDLLLVEAATRAGAKLWQPWKATGLRRDNGGHVCTITAPGGSEELCAPVVIAAHGSWDSGTLPTQTAGPHAPSDLLAFKAHFKDCELAADLMPLLAFPGGYGGMVHSDGGRASLSCCIRRDQLQRNREQEPMQRAGEVVLHHIERHCAGVQHALRHASLDRSWLSAGSIRPGIRPRYADGMFRVGNCAGEAHPIVAEGISMAMQSSALLCRRMIAGHDDVVAGRGLAEMGDGYAAEWRRSFAARIHAASLFARIAMSPTATSLGLPVAQLFPKILSVGAYLSGKADQVVAESMSRDFAPERASMADRR